MLTVLLVVQIFIVVALIATILLQQNSSDGLGGLGGGSASGGGLMSSRGTANLLTRTTAILATLFMINSLIMATMVARTNNVSFVDTQLEEQLPTPTIGDEEAGDIAPSVPLAE